MAKRKKVARLTKRKAPPRKKIEPFRLRDRYSSMRIKGFRLFDDLEFKKLNEINLFFGPNNTGKTTLLEAVYTHACGLNFAPFFQNVVLRRTEGMVSGTFGLGEELISTFRDISAFPFIYEISAKVAGDNKLYKVTAEFTPASDLLSLDPRAFGHPAEVISEEPVMDTQIFNNHSSISEAEIRQRRRQPEPQFLGTWVSKLSRTEPVELPIYFPLAPETIPPEKPFKLGNFPQLLAHKNPRRMGTIFGHLKRYGILSEFTEELRNTFPEVQEIDTFPYPDGAQAPIYIKVPDGRFFPLYVFGDGMCRWFLILGEMLVNRGAVTCIEEIDATFHPTSQRSLSQRLVEYAAKFHNQLFLTTHNGGFVDAFLDGLYGKDGIIDSQRKDPVLVFTLVKRRDGSIEVWEIGGREAHEKRKKFGLELMA